MIRDGKSLPPISGIIGCKKSITYFRLYRIVRAVTIISAEPSFISLTIPGDKCILLFGQIIGIPQPPDFLLQIFVVKFNVSSMCFSTSQNDPWYKVIKCSFDMTQIIKYQKSRPLVLVLEFKMWRSVASKIITFQSEVVAQI